jgi:hypothetical protein
MGVAYAKSNGRKPSAVIDGIVSYCAEETPSYVFGAIYKI